MKPRDTRTEKQRYNQQSDVKWTKRFWILDNGATVTLTEQMSGESSTAQIEIPKRVFNIFVDWYNTDQKTRRAT